MRKFPEKWFRIATKSFKKLLVEPLEAPLLAWCLQRAPCNGWYVTPYKRECASVKNHLSIALLKTCVTTEVGAKLLFLTIAIYQLLCQSKMASYASRHDPTVLHSHCIDWSNVQSGLLF